jgi:sterol desaturase/sphingolipid hydroxylase (fatty acid hydroxylase superfamily)
LPFRLELFLILLMADLVQYWTHRAYHEVPLLWRLHAVHHSAKHMDWLAGSRQHLLELFITRTAILGPIYILGFSKEVIDLYIVIVGFQAVFNHANVSVRLGPLRYLIVTPNFHHGHHSQDDEAIDKNYAAHFAFLDYLFGTAVSADRKWPEQYGVVGDYVPEGFLRQLMFPFRKQEPPSGDAD